MGAAANNPGNERLNTRAAGIIGLAVMCSRVLGLAREQICAALFGGGGAMDAFTAAFRIPNLLRDLFAALRSRGKKLYAGAAQQVFRTFVEQFDAEHPRAVALLRRGSRGTLRDGTADHAVKLFNA